MPAALVALVLAAGAPAAPGPEVDPAALARIREAALGSDWAWRQLEDLLDTVGPRPAGSPGGLAAEARLAAAMRAAGAAVTLQPCPVARWERGEERAELVDWPGRPAGLEQRLALTALGGSGATPAQGLTAPVVLLRDFAALEARRAEVKGAVVVFTARFDQKLAEVGRAGPAYGQAARYRFTGPSKAAALGAAAVLVRSVGGADWRLPHTGLTRWEEKQAPIPAAALAAEDVELLERLAARGPVRLRLTLTPRLLPEATAHNVVAELPGREAPGEVVLVSGHLDSWDLSPGAHDDAGPTLAAFGAVELLQRLGLRPRRTIRAVAFTDEENGGRGARCYAASVKERAGAQVAALESDAGAGRPFGLAAAVPREARERLRPVLEALAAMGAGVVDWRAAEEHLGADIAPLQALGVPTFAPLVDTRHYFDVHHTAADTLDKVDPDALRRQVAVMAVVAWALAELPEPLPRLPVAGK